MKKSILTLVISSVLFSCKSQQRHLNELDSISFDFENGVVSQDTLRFDVNGDGLKDILLQFDYKVYDAVPKGNSGHELAVFLQKESGGYYLKSVNRMMLWVVNTKVYSLDSTTFCIVNEESGHDNNNYYCYFRFNSEKQNWFLYKYQIKTFNTGKELLIKEKVYEKDKQTSFKESSFDLLFGEIHEKSFDVMYNLLIEVDKAIIYSKVEKPTKMYLVKGDVVELLEDKDEWLKIRYYGKKTIEGWIKKSDVIGNN